MPKRLVGLFSYRVVLRSLLDRPAIVIIAATAVTLFFALQIPKLTISSSIHDFIIKDHPDTVRYREFRELFGSDEIIRIVVKSENVFDPETFQKIENLADNAGRIQGVRRVVSLPGIRKAMDVSDKWDLAEFAKILAPVALFQKNIISEDFRTTALTLVLHTDANVESVIRGVDSLIENAPEDLSLYQIGMPLVSKSLADYTRTDFFRIPPVTFLLIAVILLFLFQNFQCLVFPLACVSAALVWTFGLMAIFDVALSMLTMIVPVFVIAVGTAYCLYICSEYTERARHAESSDSAVFLTFSEMTLPTFLAVFTTVIGVGSLLVNRIAAIGEFAVFSCAGISSLLIILLTVFPCALKLAPLPKKKNTAVGGGNGMIDRLLDIIVNIILKRQGTVLLVIAVAVLFCAIGIFRLRAETNPVDYFKKSTPVSRNFHDIYKDLSGSFPVNVVMNGRIENYFEEPEAAKQIETLQAYLDTLPGVDKTVSFADYTKLAHFALNQFDPAFYVLPTEGFEMRMAMNNYKSMLGDDMFTRFMNPDFSTANIFLLTHISSSAAFLKLEQDILSHVAANFPKDIGWRVTGFAMAISASGEALVDGQVKSLSLTMILIFGVMILLFLSAKVGLVAILAACFPIAVNFGLMGWFGIKLSVATSLIASIAIGLAVDDIIHYLVRYSREFKKDLDKDRALRDTVRGVGKPIIFTTLTIGTGFSILIFSHFVPTAVFGLLMVITLTAALIGDLILLPALMLHVELVTAWDLLRLMPTLGGMSSGIAHEMNQPLTVIKMGGDLLNMICERDGPVEKEQLRKVVGEIRSQVERASEMVNRLRKFEVVPHFEKTETDINEPIRDTLAIVSPQLRLTNIEIDLQLEENLPKILAYKNRLSQAVFNLVNNAIEAVESGDPEKKHVITIRSYTDGKHVVLAISDTGPGIPSHLRDRIFEPFFTTKGLGKGKGLGLSIVNQIVISYNGRVKVETGEDGATFKLFFPPAAPFPA